MLHKYCGGYHTMSKDMKTVHGLLDYTKQLKLHTEGRRALHVRISILEKYLQEEHYREFVAACFRPLITDYNATTFSLPNNDLVILVKDASIDVIDPLLTEVRRKYKESSIVGNIDAIQGTSDTFVEWFNLETDYDVFKKYTAQLAEAILTGAKAPATRAKPAQQVKKTSAKKSENAVNPETGLLKIQPENSNDAPIPSAPQRKMKKVAIQAPKKRVQNIELNPEMLLTISNAISSADMTGMLQNQRVMAMVGIQSAIPVMAHKCVPLPFLYSKLLKNRLQIISPWLEGYLNDVVANRVLASIPNMTYDESLASSLSVTITSVLGPAFDEFNSGLGDQSRSNIILEFSSIDVTSNFSNFLDARIKIEKLGFKTSIAGIDPRALSWLNLGALQADFIKVQNPGLGSDEWLDDKTEDHLIGIIDQIGIGRVILNGCTTGEDVNLGQRLGITLFQGDAVDPYVLV